MVGNLAAIKDYTTDYIYSKKGYTYLDSMANDLLIKASKEYINKNYFNKSEFQEIFNAISDEQFGNIIKDYMQKNFFNKTTIELIIRRRKGESI